jgi:hypothetical protein
MKIRLKAKVDQKKESSLLFVHLFISTPLWVRPQLDKLIDLFCKYDEWMPDQWELCVDRKRMTFSENVKADIIKSFQPISRGLTDVRTKEGVIREEIIGFEAIEFLRKISPKYSLRMDQHSGPKRDLPNDITFEIRADTLKPSHCESLILLVSDICNTCRVDFGRIQYYTSEEVANAGFGSLSKSEAVSFYAHSRDLYYRYVPDLYNVTIWGLPYIDFFGKEKILQAPCYKTIEMTSGLIWMQLAPGVCDATITMDALKDVREKVKTYLNNDAFFNLNYPRNEIYDEDLHKYKLPKFDLSAIQAPVKLSEGPSK